MSNHFDKFADMKGLVRGKQFTEYVQGKMVPRGERTPRGGAPGDCHRLYDTMNVDDPISLHGLFDNAEVSAQIPFLLRNCSNFWIMQDSMILNEVTRIIAPDIHANVLKEGKVGEFVGPDSLTLYYCKNYAAPLHIDNDASTGLCAQLRMEVNGLAYSFVHYSIKRIFHSRTNSIWCV